MQKLLGGAAHLRRVLVLASLVLGLAPASAFGQSAADIARDYVQRNFRQLGLTGSDINEIGVSGTVVSQHNGVTHVYLRSGTEASPSTTAR